MLQKMRLIHRVIGNSDHKSYWTTFVINCKYYNKEFIIKNFSFCSLFDNSILIYQKYYSCSAKNIPRVVSFRHFLKVKTVCFFGRVHKIVLHFCRDDNNPIHTRRADTVVSTVKQLNIIPLRVVGQPNGIVLK